MGLVLSSPSIPSFLWGFQSLLLKGFEESLPLQRHTVRPWAQFGIFPIGQQCPNNILSTKHRDTSGGKEHKVLLSLIQTLLNCSDSFFTKPFLGKKGKFSYPEMLCRFASAFIELSKITFFFFKESVGIMFNEIWYLPFRIIKSRKNILHTICFLVLVFS